MRASAFGTAGRDGIRSHDEVDGPTFFAATQGETIHEAKPVVGHPDLIKSDIVRWRAVINDAKITAE
jgi:hypothetical protein